MPFYIESPILRKVGIGLFLVGVLSVLGVGLAHHFSGTVVATANTTKPLPQTNLAEQSLQAQSQALLQNTMNKMGVPALRTDKIETLDTNFTPIHLSPDMGKVELTLEVHVRGIVATNRINNRNQEFKRRTFQLVDQSNGKVVFQNEIKRMITVNSDEQGNTSEIAINGSKTSANISTALQFIRVGFLDVPMDGNYVLNATFEKLQYAYPIESMKLIAKKDTMPLPGIEIIALMVGSALIGMILCLLTTPPELRGNKIKTKIRI